MQISKNRWNYSFREGTDTEKRFKTLLESEGYKVEKSSKQDDIHKHHHHKSIKYRTKTPTNLYKFYNLFN